MISKLKAVGIFESVIEYNQVLDTRTCCFQYSYCDLKKKKLCLPAHIFRLGIQIFSVNVSSKLQKETIFPPKVKKTKATTKKTHDLDKTQLLPSELQMNKEKNFHP